jgi:hypothetical protein
LEAELVAERARLAAVERREKVLQAQIVKEVQAQSDLKQQRDQAVDEVTALKAERDKATLLAKALNKTPEAKTPQVTVALAFFVACVALFFIIVVWLIAAFGWR